MKALSFGLMPKLFISHASEDKDFVRFLADALKREAMEVWLDELSMTLGDSYFFGSLVRPGRVV